MINNVGITYRKYEDASRRNWDGDGPRPLTMAIWYPAEETGRQLAQRVALFKTGRYEPDAMWAMEQQSYPLVMVSHGTGGSTASIAWLCVRLAQAGFVAAAVNHHGNTGAEPEAKLEGFLHWWERPLDIRAGIDAICSDDSLNRHIDSERIVVAGFSLGGYTALATVGAKVDLTGWAEYCQNNPDDPIATPPPEAPFTAEQMLTAVESLSADVTLKGIQDRLVEPRIRGAFAISPVASPLYSTESLAAISRPVHIVTGSRDNQALEKQVSRDLVAHIPNCTSHCYDDAGHYSFLSEGVWHAKLRLPMLFRDPPGLNRKVLHDDVAEEAVKFFDRLF